MQDEINGTDKLITEKTPLMIPTERPETGHLEDGDSFCLFEPESHSVAQAGARQP